MGLARPSRSTAIPAPDSSCMCKRSRWRQPSRWLGTDCSGTLIAAELEPAPQRRREASLRGLRVQSWDAGGPGRRAGSFSSLAITLCYGPRRQLWQRGDSCWHREATATGHRFQEFSWCEASRRLALGAKTLRPRNMRWPKQLGLLGFCGFICLAFVPLTVRLPRLYLSGFCDFICLASAVLSAWLQQFCKPGFRGFI